MATPLTGVDGVVEIDGTAVENLQEWSWEPDGKTVSVGGFGTKWDTMKPSLISVKGSCKGIWATGASGQLAVQNAFKNQTLVNLTLGATASEHVVQPAYITKLTSNAKFDDVAGFEFDYVGSGEPTTYPGH